MYFSVDIWKILCYTDKVVGGQFDRLYDFLSKLNLIFCQVSGLQVFVDAPDVKLFKQSTCEKY